MTDTLIARVYRLAHKLGGTVHADEGGYWEIRVPAHPGAIGILIGADDIDEAECEAMEAGHDR